MSRIFLTANDKLIKVRGGFASFDPDDPDRYVWYTLTTSDVTGSYNAYHKAYFVNAINTGSEHPNIVFPAMLDGHPTRWDMGADGLNANIIRLKFEERSDASIYNVIIGGSSSNYNSTLKAVYGIPSVNALTIQYTSALETVDLSNMGTASSVLISYNSALRSIPQIPEGITGLTTLKNKLWHNASAVNKKYTIPEAVTDMSSAFMYNSISDFTFDTSWDHVTSYNAAIGNNPVTELTFPSNMAETLDSAWAGGTIGGGTWFDYVMTTRSGNILHGSSYTMAPVTVHCAYGSPLYTKLRYAQASQNYMMRNLRLSLTDNHSLKNISFWGDSLTRRNESTSIQSNMVEHFYNWTAADVWCWNEGHGGSGSGTTFPSDYGCQEARWGDDVHVIWIGTNDTILTEQQTIANIQTMINTCGLNNYIVLQPFGWGYAEGNESLYEAAFPGITINTHRYIIEHGFEVLGREPTAEEQEQLANNTIPDVFVDTSDMTHITDSGGLCIATAVKEKLLTLGYITSSWLKED